MLFLFLSGCNGLKTTFSGDSLIYIGQRLFVIVCHCRVSWWHFGGQTWQLSLAHECRRACRPQLGCQAVCVCALERWVPAQGHLLRRWALSPGSLPASGASLDSCHLQHVLAVPNLKWLWKLSTARVGWGPGGPTALQWPQSQLWVLQPGRAEWSHHKWAGWTTVAHF